MLSEMIETFLSDSRFCGNDSFFLLFCHPQLDWGSETKVKKTKPNCVQPDSGFKQRLDTSLQDLVLSRMFLTRTRKLAASQVQCQQTGVQAFLTGLQASHSFALICLNAERSRS